MAYRNASLMREAYLSGIRIYCLNNVFDCVVKFVNEDEEFFGTSVYLEKQPLPDRWLNIEDVSPRDKELLVVGAKFQLVCGNRVYKNGHRESLTYLVFDRDNSEK